MKRFLFLTLLLTPILIGTVSAQAANHFVLAGALGNKSGNDWTNAYTTLPATLIRGDIYYIGAGSYPAYTFDDPHSGTTFITIKKATVADHGTDVGWQASYAAQAVFQSTLHFSNGYYVFDGQTRNESDWFDGAAYGFRVDHNNQDQNISIYNQSLATPNITVKYVYVNSQVGNLPDVTIARYAINTDTQGGPTNSGLVFSRMFVNGSNNVWFLRTTSGAILEYSASQNASGNSANHGEVVNLYYSASNAIIRHNIFRNEYVPSGSTAMIAVCCGTNSIQVYGNVFSNFRAGDGAIGYLGGTVANSVIYNNTIDQCNVASGGGANGGIALGSSTTLIQNNLFTNCTRAPLCCTHDYNAFSDSTDQGEAHAQLNVDSSIYVSYAAQDFRLARATAAGLALAAPFNVDRTAATRGADGVWDRGAFETSGGTPAPPAPTNLRISGLDEVLLAQFPDDKVFPWSRRLFRWPG